MTEATDFQRLTRTVIRGKLAELTAMDRDLTRRLAAMAGKPGMGATPNAARAEKTVERARQLLNGAGHILAKVGDNPAGEAALFAEQAAVQMAISALRKEDTEAASVEALEWAEAHRPAWETVCREMLLTAVRAEALGVYAMELAAVGKEGRFGLPLFGLLGYGAHLTFTGLRLPLKEVVERAIAEGLVTRAEVKTSAVISPRQPKGREPKLGVEPRCEAR